jgi:aminoglycoside phosphotransferase (APT) family kinase protein
MALHIDTPVETRKGEELDIKALNKYLQSHVADITEVQTVSQFPGGYSNLTYLVSTLDKEYVLRRPPLGAKIASAHDMSREFRVLSMLEGHYAKIPKPTVFCEDEAILGSPFYMMERVKGIILRAKDATNPALTPTLMADLSKSLIDNLADLHALDLTSTKLITLGKPEGYVPRQVAGWIKRYNNAITDDLPDMERIASWMQDNLPPEQSPTFIHNDYKYDNVVLNPNNVSEIAAVLDWEMATVGDPLIDLGTSLAYWSENNDEPFTKYFNLTWLPGNMTREEVVQYYAKRTGRDVSNFVFYYVYGLYKNAVIAQQIYARWKAGFSKDPRFGALIDGVKLYAKMGIKAIETNRI